VKEKERINKLQTKEEEHKTETSTAILLWLLSKKSLAAIALGLPALAKVIEKPILSARSSGNAIASEYLGSKARTVKADLASATVSTSLAAQVTSKVLLQTSEGTELAQAIPQAVKLSEPAIERTVATELFTEHNNTIIRQVRSRKESGTLVYSAIMDKRTCYKCSRLDGSTYDAKAEIPAIPQHPLCRCFWVLLTD
jgi:SPP1 gp7 family putative phage head morphogenesis protein